MSIQEEKNIHFYFEPKIVIQNEEIEEFSAPLGNRVNGKFHTWCLFGVTQVDHPQGEHLHKPWSRTITCAWWSKWNDLQTVRKINTIFVILVIVFGCQ